MSQMELPDGLKIEEDDELISSSVSKQRIGSESSSKAKDEQVIYQKVSIEDGPAGGVRIFYPLLICPSMI